MSKQFTKRFRTTGIILAVVLILVVILFVVYFSLLKKVGDDSSLILDSDDSRLLPPPEDPIEQDKVTFEIHTEEEDLDERVSEIAHISDVEGSNDEDEVVVEDFSSVSRDGWTSYTNTLYSYSFEIPSEWYRDAETTETAWVAAFSSFDPATATNVNDLPGAKVEVLVQENTEGLSLDQLAEDMKRFSSATHEESDTTLGGIAAKRLVVDLPKKSFVVVAVRDLDVFTVSFTGNEVDAEQSMFDGIIQSFVL